MEFVSKEDFSQFLVTGLRSNEGEKEIRRILKEIIHDDGLLTNSKR